MVVSLRACWPSLAGFSADFTKYGAKSTPTKHSMTKTKFKRNTFIFLGVFLLAMGCPRWGFENCGDCDDETAGRWIWESGDLGLLRCTVHARAAVNERANAQTKKVVVNYLSLQHPTTLL